MSTEFLGRYFVPGKTSPIRKRAFSIVSPPTSRTFTGVKMGGNTQRVVMGPQVAIVLAIVVQ